MDLPPHGTRSQEDFLSSDSLSPHAIPDHASSGQPGVTSAAEGAETSSATEVELPWCWLISKLSQHPNITIYKSVFSIGNDTCDLPIPGTLHPAIEIHKELKVGEVIKTAILPKSGTTGFRFMLGGTNIYHFPFDARPLEDGSEIKVFYGSVIREYIFHKFSEKEEVSVDLNKNVPPSLEKFGYFLSEDTIASLLGNITAHKIINDKLHILLSGPAGSSIYQEKLCKAVASYFTSECYILDKDWYPSGIGYAQTHAYEPASPSLPGFQLGDRIVYVGPKFGSATVPFKGPKAGMRGTIALHFDDNSKIGVIFDQALDKGLNFGLTGEEGKENGFICKINDVVLDPEGDGYELFISSLFLKALESQTVKHPTYLFIRDIEGFLQCGDTREFIHKLPKNVVVIGSKTYKDAKKVFTTSQLVASLFTREVCIEMPKEVNEYENLKLRFKEDTQQIIMLKNKRLMRDATLRCGLRFKDGDSYCITDQLLSMESADAIIRCALGLEVRNDPTSSYSDIFLTEKSLKTSLSNFTAKNKAKQLDLFEILNDTETNIFEKTILEEVIVSSSKIGLKYDDIGGLDSVKDALNESVVYPLKRPELFAAYQLRKTHKGVLLFGPPGTGKSMMAEAVATEAAAYLINVSASTICSKESEESMQYVKAAFSVARKIAPCVIFIDEAERILAKSSALESERHSMIKNSIISNWDDMISDEVTGVIVIAATSHPLNLDEVAVRRFPYRLPVDLPNAEERVKILQLIVGKKDLVSDEVYNILPKATPNHSGGDLKNLCVRAVYKRAKDIIGNPDKVNESKDIRPLDLNDFEYAEKQVGATTSSQSEVMKDMLEWKKMYGI